MKAARPDIGEYTEYPSGGWSLNDSQYWYEFIRPRVLSAIGIHELGEEARRRMEPDSPDLALTSFTGGCGRPQLLCGMRAANRKLFMLRRGRSMHECNKNAAITISRILPYVVNPSAGIHLCLDGHAFGSPGLRAQTPHGEVDS